MHIFMHILLTVILLMTLQNPTFILKKLYFSPLPLFTASFQSFYNSLYIKTFLERCSYIILISQVRTIFSCIEFRFQSPNHSPHTKCMQEIQTCVVLHWLRTEMKNFILGSTFFSSFQISLKFLFQCKKNNKVNKYL